MFYFVLLVIGLVGGVVAVLVIENFSAFATSVQLSFYTWHSPALPIGLWLLISCLSGALIMYLLSIPIALLERRELRMLRRRVAELEQAQQSAQGDLARVYPPAIIPIPGISPDLLSPTPAEYYDFEMR